MLRLGDEVYMANYVSNYVLCNKKLYDDFCYVPFTHRIFREGIYDLEGYELDGDRNLIIFETRGVEYKEEQIVNIISQYNDTLWYCIEENNIEQGTFLWDGRMVCKTKRELQEAVSGCIFCIEYTDRFLRPLKSVFAFKDRIIIEKYLQNKKEVYYLTEDESNKLVVFIDEMVRKMISNNLSYDGEFLIYGDKNIWTQIALWQSNGTRSSIESCDERDLPDEKFYETGKYYEELILMFFKRFLMDNNIGTNLVYNEIKEFLLD